MVAVGTLVAAAGMFWLSRLTTTSDYLTDVMLPMSVLTAGLGSVFVPVTLAAVSGAAREHSGLVSGVSTTVMQVGGAIGIAVLATVATTSTGNASATEPVNEALAHGFGTAFFVSAWILAAAAPIALAALRLRSTADEAAMTHGAGGVQG